MLLSSRNSLAIFLTLFALLALTLKDGADKYLVLHGYSVMEMVWFRFFVPFLGLLLLLPRRTVSALLAVDRWLLLRSLLFLVCALVSVIALAHVPLNVYTIICQLGSLAFVVAGVIFFRERLTRAKVAAVLLGLFGVLVVTHPDGGDANLYYLLPLVIVLANTGYNLITKLVDPRLTTLDILIVTCFMLGMVAMVALCWQPALWRFPALADWPYLLALPVVTLLSQYCLIKAMQYAQASTLAPFFYFQIFFSTLCGYLMFGEMPTLSSMAGCLLIVLAGIVVIHSQRRASVLARSEAPEQV